MKRLVAVLVASILVSLSVDVALATTNTPTPTPTEPPEPLLVFELVVTPAAAQVGDQVELTFYNRNIGNGAAFSPIYTLVGTEGYFTGDTSEIWGQHLMGYGSVNTIVYDLRAIAEGIAMVYLNVLYETCDTTCSFNGHASSPVYEIVIGPTPTPTSTPTQSSTPTTTPTGPTPTLTPPPTYTHTPALPTSTPTCFFPTPPTLTTAFQIQPESPVVGDLVQVSAFFDVLAGPPNLSEISGASPVFEDTHITGTHGSFGSWIVTLEMRAVQPGTATVHLRFDYEVTYAICSPTEVYYHLVNDSASFNITVLPRDTPTPTATPTPTITPGLVHSVSGGGCSLVPVADRTPRGGALLSLAACILRLHRRREGNTCARYTSGGPHDGDREPRLPSRSWA